MGKMLQTAVYRVDEINGLDDILDDGPCVVGVFFLLREWPQKSSQQPCLPSWDGAGIYLPNHILTRHHYSSRHLIKPKNALGYTLFFVSKCLKMIKMPP